MGNPHVFYKLGIMSEDVIEDMLTEANRAHELHNTNSMLYGSDDKSLRIAVEEVGEVAREMNELALGHRTDREYVELIYKEVIQTAAMFATWAEKLHRSRSTLGNRFVDANENVRPVE